LGGIAINNAIKQAGVAKENVDEVIMGNVVSAGMGNDYN
jgi:acetyl-CoA C-acetyltransferase